MKKSPTKYISGDGVSPDLPQYFIRTTPPRFFCRVVDDEDEFPLEGLTYDAGEGQSFCDFVWLDGFPRGKKLEQVLAESAEALRDYDLLIGAEDAGHDYLTLPEVEEETGIPHKTLRAHCRAGKIPGAKRFGRDWAIPAEVAEDLQRRPPGRPPKSPSP